MLRANRKHCLPDCCLSALAENTPSATLLVVLTLTMQERWGKRALTDSSGREVAYVPALERLVATMRHGTTLRFRIDDEGRAINLDAIQPNLAPYLPLLNDEAVFSDQRLLLARAELNEKSNPAAAIADLTVMFERFAKLLDVPYVRRVFNALADDVRLALVEPLRAWVATRTFTELDDTKFDLSWWSESQLVKLSNVRREQQAGPARARRAERHGRSDSRPREGRSAARRSAQQETRQIVHVRLDVRRFARRLR
jgi:hypothetical protein